MYLNYSCDSYESGDLSFLYPYRPPFTLGKGRMWQVSCLWTVVMHIILMCYQLFYPYITVLYLDNTTLTPFTIYIFLYSKY